MENTANSLGPFDFHVLRCGENSFPTKEQTLIHTYYADEYDEDQKNQEDLWRAQRELDE